MLLLNFNNFVMYGANSNCFCFDDNTAHKIDPIRSSVTGQTRIEGSWNSSGALKESLCIPVLQGAI